MDWNGQKCYNDVVQQKRTEIDWWTELDWSRLNGLNWTKVNRMDWIGQNGPK